MAGLLWIEAFATHVGLKSDSGILCCCLGRSMPVHVIAGLLVELVVHNPHDLCAMYVKKLPTCQLRKSGCR